MRSDGRTDRRGPRGAVVWMLLGVAGIAAGEAAGQEFSDRAVERAIARGVKFLWSRRQKDGSWKKQDAHTQKPWTVGPTAICAYALLESGVRPTDGPMAPTMRFLERTKTDATYGLAFRALAYAVAVRYDTKYRELLRKDVSMLVRSLSRDGGFGYTAAGRTPPKRPDQSNSQYGLLGAWMGAVHYLEVPVGFWQQSLAYWRRHQLPDGGWGYDAGSKHSSTPMTLAGLASVYVCFDNLYAARFVECRGNARFLEAERALAWVAKRPRDVFAQKDHLYYTLYGIERVGLATGLKFLGSYDWYRGGATELIRRQEKDGSWSKPGGAHSGGPATMTAYALLFLLRGRRPVLLNRLEFSGDWNNRPRALANLTRWMSRNFERGVHWQIVNLRTPVEQWHDAPILVLTGSAKIDLSNADLDKIRRFVHQGGTIFSIAECEGDGFRKGIREVYRRLFPKYPLRPAGDGHPIHSAYSRLTGDVKFFEVSNGARPLAIHTDTDVASAWQAMRHVSESDAFQAAVNVVAYTNDKTALAPGGLRFRGTSLWPDRPKRASARAVKLARLAHSGNYDPEPLAFERFRRLMAGQAKTHVDLLGPMPIVRLHGSGAPLAVMTGTGRLELTAAERQTLKSWLIDGGTLVIDAAGGSRAFYESAEAMLIGLFGRRAVRRLAHTAPLFGVKGFEITRARYRRRTRTLLGNLTQANLKTVLVDDRPAVYLSREDITTALVGCPSYTVYGYSPQTAFELMRNICLTCAGREAPGATPVQLIASASVAADQARRAVHGQRDTRWSTGRPMKPGDWLAIDLGRHRVVRGLILDTSRSAEDFPRGYEIYASPDGRDWGKPVAAGKPSNALTVVLLPKPLSARHVKIVQTGRHDRLHWSVHEVMIQYE